MLAAVLTVPTATAAIVSALVRTRAAENITLLVAVAFVLVASQLFPEGRLDLGLCAVLSITAAVLAFFWAPLAVLDLRGDPVTATVSGVHVIGGKQRMYQYQLRGPDGRTLPGALTEYQDVYRTGDRVDVVADRDAELDPVEAGDLDGVRGLGLATGALLLLTVAASVPVGSRHHMEQVASPFRRYRPRH
ncbi:hypothetical protein Cs7R123_66370 [Catellatospora sp. TT07R-123]|nr:hypothetical protein Cs7R123_66370 [Catellatospora sp. TT07R-123]